ncbi:MAG: type II toxin-antitoxin system prevent-host-death family antitoxin [Proteobacteria bacterium]|nr:type II toxin-antitoxin system prevent-host-death family antitoxin [Pseudomonadota bacterium]
MKYKVKEEAAQYVIDKKGKPKAVILPVEEYQRILVLISELTDRKESKNLSRSREFKKLVRRGLKEIKEKKAIPWDEVWNEL